MSRLSLKLFLTSAKDYFTSDQPVLSVTSFVTVFNDDHPPGPPTTTCHGHIAPNRAINSLKTSRTLIFTQANIDIHIIASRPHPWNSFAHDEVRAYLWTTHSSSPPKPPRHHYGSNHPTETPRKHPILNKPKLYSILHGRPHHSIPSTPVQFVANDEVLAYLL
ncbi:hypothetical protein BDQ17DRAFT_1433721 [Cyathus striatus]|nr:hypothetical protein BDQ17DRAFT_1433721 [Cyathus striatus]